MKISKSQLEQIIREELELQKHNVSRVNEAPIEPGTVEAFLKVFEAIYESALRTGLLTGLAGLSISELVAAAYRKYNPGSEKADAVKSYSRSKYVNPER